MRKKAWLGIAGVLGAVLLGMWMIHAPSPGLTTLGEESRWALNLEARLENADRGSPGSSKTTVVTGDWVVAVSGASAAGYDLACQIDHPHVTGNGFGEVKAADVASLEQRLGTRFWVSYRTDGAAARAHFPRDMSDDVRNLLQLIVTQTQLVRPARPTTQWTATERDGAGTYFAAYQQPSSGQIRKRRLRYVAFDGASDAAASGLRIGVDASDTRFTVDAQGRLAEVDSREASHLDAQLGSVRLGIDIGIRLEHLRSGRAPSLVGSLDRARAGLESGPIVTQRPTDQAALARRDAQLIDGVTLEQILAALRERRADDASRSRLEALLRRRPAAIAPAVAAARAPADGGDEVSRTVLFALGAAGTPEAQNALCALAADETVATPLRVDATMALVRTDRPTASTVAALLGLMDDRAPAIRRQALFTAGTVANHGRVSDPAAASRLESALLARYAGCTGPSCLDLMVALGNLATPAAMPALARSLREASPPLRAQAARGLRLVQDPNADRLIAATLGQDSDGAVRAAAVFAASFRPIGPLVEALAQAARFDAADYVRAGAVNVLAGHVDDSPLVAPTLVAVAAHDSKAAIRRLAREALGRRAPTPEKGD